MSEIRVIIKKPGEAAFETLVENELRPLQEWVGGYIETYALSPLPLRGSTFSAAHAAVEIPNATRAAENAAQRADPAVLVICNEEGKILGLPYNCKLAGEHFVGTILLVGIGGEEGEEFADCPVALKTALAFWPELRGPKKRK